MVGYKLPMLTITNRLYFRDDGMYIDGRTDGTLNITSDSAITLNGNCTIPTGKTFTVTDGAVNLGTGALTLGGNATLATNKYLSFTAGTETFRFPNDGVIASGNKYAQSAGVGGEWWMTPIASSNVCGWLRLKVASGSSWHTLYTPLFSSNAW
jgi:hypothetical protein